MRGLLRITAPVQFGRRHIAPVVARFLDAHDGVEVELLLNDRNIDLIDEGIDVALRIGPLGRFDAVGAAWSAMCGGCGWRARPISSAAARRVRRPTWRVTRRSWGPCAATGNGASPACARAPRLMGRLRVDDVETRLRAAREGRGVAQLLSYQVADELASGKLVRLLQAWEAPPLPVHLVTKGRAHRAPKIDAFVEFAAKRLKALPVLLSGD